MKFLALKRHLPPTGQVTPVLATIMFLVYTYAFYRLFWYVPSWLNYLPIQSIVSIVAYMAFLALFESLAILALLILIVALLPAQWFRECFVTTGTLAVWVLSAGALLVHENLVGYLAPFSFAELVRVLLTVLGGIVATTALIAYLVRHHFKVLEALINGLAERMTILLYVYLPFSGLGLAVVLVRLAR